MSVVICRKQPANAALSRIWIVVLPLLHHIPYQAQYHVISLCPFLLPGVALSIQHIPLTGESRSLIEDEGGNIREFPDGYVAEIKLKVKSVTFIRKLARAIRQTIGRGKRYHNPNWKWICPRTAASLERFATVLKTYNTERQ